MLISIFIAVHLLFTWFNSEFTLLISNKYSLNLPLQKWRISFSTCKVQAPPKQHRHEIPNTRRFEPPWPLWSGGAGAQRTDSPSGPKLAMTLDGQSLSQVPARSRQLPRRKTHREGTPLRVRHLPGPDGRSLGSVGGIQLPWLRLGEASLQPSLNRQWYAHHWLVGSGRLSRMQSARWSYWLRQQRWRS